VPVVSGERFETRKVTTGIRGSPYIEVLDGLTEEALVISPFQSVLSERARVRYATPSP
jgi:hypothetical protein